MEVVVDHARGFIRIRVTGAQSRSTLEAAIEELIGHPEWDESLNRLWDCREAELEGMTGGDIRQLRDSVERRGAVVGTGRTAYIVSRDVDFGMVNMFRLIAEDSLPIEIQAFRDPEEAERWVTKSPASPA